MNDQIEKLISEFCSCDQKDRKWAISFLFSLRLSASVQSDPNRQQVFDLIIKIMDEIYQNSKKK